MHAHTYKEEKREIECSFVYRKERRNEDERERDRERDREITMSSDSRRVAIQAMLAFISLIMLLVTCPLIRLNKTCISS